MRVFFMDTYSDIHESLQILRVELYHKYTLDGYNFSIYDEEQQTKSNLELIDLLVSKKSILKGGYLIRTIASAAGSLLSIITYLINLVDQNLIYDA